MLLGTKNGLTPLPLRVPVEPRGVGEEEKRMKTVETVWI